MATRDDAGGPQPPGSTEHDTPERPRPRSGTVFLLGVSGIALLGAGLRLIGLGERELWFDESCTFAYVHHLFDWPGGFWSLVVEGLNLPYYLLLKGWLRWAGESEAGFRSLSVLAGTLGIVLTAGLTRSLGGAAAGAVCAMLLAVHPLHLYYAREARAYALWTLLIAAALWLLVEAVRRSGERHHRRWWLAFGATLWVCLQVHYYTIFLLPALPAACLLSSRPSGAAWRCLRQLVVTLVVVLAVFPPISFWPYFGGHPQSVAAWIAPRFNGLSALEQTLWCFLPAGNYPGHLRGLSLASPETATTQPAWLIGLSPVVAVGVVIVMAAAAVRRWVREGSLPADRGGTDGESRRRSRDRIPAWEASLVLLLLTAVPLVLAWLYSLLVRPVYLPGRYDLVAFPSWMALLAIVLVSAVGSDNERRRWWLAGMVTVLAAAALVPVDRLLSQRAAPSLHRLRASRLADLTRTDDLVVAFSYDRDYLQYYLHRAGFAGRLVAFPSWLERQVGWLDTDADLAEARSAALDEDARQRAVLIFDVLRRGHRVLVLGDSLDPRATSRRALIQQRLFSPLQESHCLLQPVDANLGIGEVVCSLSLTVSAAREQNR